MRTLMAVFSALMLLVPVASSAGAEVSPHVSYQGRVLDAAGEPVAGPIDIEIGIWDSATGGEVLYQEQHLATPLDSGIFNLQIGTGTSPTGALNASTFSSADRWLELAIGGDVLAPRQPFSSVAYTFRAERADVATTAGEVTVRGAGGEPRTVVQILDPGVGFVAARGPNDRNNVRMTFSTTDSDRGFLAVDSSEGAPRATMQVLAAGEGYVSAIGPNGQANVRMTANVEDPNLGFLSADANGASRAQMNVLTAGEGFVATRGPSGSTNVRLTALSADPDLGFLAVDDINGVSHAQLNVVASSGAGLASVRGPNGNQNARLTSAANSPDLGAVEALNAGGTARVSMQVVASGEGVVDTRGPSGESNVVMGGDSHDPDIGLIDVRDETGRSAVDMTALSSGDGVIHVWGQASQPNVLFGGVTDNSDHGEVVVADALGEPRAGLRVNAMGQGELFADVKNFIVPYPNRPDAQITYSSLEGPEVGIYHRGVVTLSDGTADIRLPQHFLALASPASITVQLTPASFGSRGVGCAIRDDGTIEVREFNGGTGSYDVHFAVYAVRRPYEGFEPVVTAEAPAAHAGAQHLRRRRAALPAATSREESIP